MKLTFEPSAGEAEVVVRGDPGDPEVPRILAALQTAAVRQGRLLLRKAGTEREYLLEPEKIDYFSAREGGVLYRSYYPNVQKSEAELAALGVDLARVGGKR